MPGGGAAQSGGGAAGMIQSGSGGSGNIGNFGGSANAGMPGSSGTSGAVAGNLIPNGDFSSGTTGWQIVFEDEPATAPVINGAVCVTVGTDQLYTVGWPATGSPGVALQPGNYVLSYKASTSGPLALFSFTAKVGGAELPFATDFQQVDQVSTQLQVFSDPFMTTGDTDAGVVFLIEGGYSVEMGDTSQVCLTDISLTPAQ